jgi:hypothetical protein
MKSEKSQIKRDGGCKHEFVRAENEELEKGQLTEENGHDKGGQDSWGNTGPRSNCIII